MAKVISSIGDTSINRTSELINDGENSTSRFVEEIDLAEQVPDAVGNALVDTSTIDFTYNDIANTITADVKPNSITATQLADNVNISEFVNDAGYELTSNKGIPNGYPSLDGGGKIPVNQLPNSVMEYKGIYDASTNTPILVNGTGNTGDVYRTTVAGAGVNGLDFVVGDYATYNGTIWEKAHSGADNVTSVFGRLGTVVAQNNDYTASQITNVPSGSISSITVQAALNELDIEKAIDTDVVHKAGVETITGVKTFSAFTNFNNFIFLAPNITSSGGSITSTSPLFTTIGNNMSVFSAKVTGFGASFDTNSLTTNRIFTFPNQSGTFALTSDLIPYALDTNVIHKTGDETKNGQLQVNINSPSLTALQGINSGAGIGVGGLSSSGYGVFARSTTGTALRVLIPNGNTSPLASYNANGVDVSVLDYQGNLTSTSFIKSGAPINNILLAGGSDIPQSTFVPSIRTININGITQDLSADRQWRAGLSNTGALTYVGATVASTTQINVGAVTGVITDNETTPGTPSYQLVTYAGGTNITVPTIAGGTGTYVLLNSAGTLVFQNTFPTSAQRKSMIYLSKISHPNLATISFAIDEPDFVNSPLQQFRDLFQVIQYMNQGITISGNAGLTINSTNGVVLGDGINFVLDKTNPNMLSVAAGAPRNFLLLNQSGAVGGFVTTIDPANYDVGGVTTPIGGSVNSTTIQYLYYAPGVGFAILRGQTVYPTLLDAVSAVGRESFVLRPNLVNNSILIAAICLRRTTTAMNDPAFVRILLADKFGQIGGASSGISVTNLQTAYNNSLIPQITTTSALGAVTLRNGGALNTDNVFAVQNLAGTTTASINGNGIYTGGANLIGTPTSTTPSAGDNSTRIATTAFVENNYIGLTGGDNISGKKFFSNGLLKQVTILDDTGLNSTMLVNSPANNTSIYSTTGNNGVNYHSIASIGTTGITHFKATDSAGTTVFQVNQAGNTTATSFIKSGATTTNILLAGGTDIPQSTFALASGSANYIQNQNAAAQTANMWISGNANIINRFSVGTNIFVGSEKVNISFDSNTSIVQGLNIKDIYASASGSAFQVFRKNDDTYVGNIRRSGTDNSLYVGGNDYLTLGTGDTEKVRILNNGNVGIGTTNPTTPLNIKHNQAVIKLETATESDAYWTELKNTYDTNSFKLINRTAGLTRELLGRYSDNLALMATGGNVLIGTTTDNGVDALQVNGSVGINGSVTSYDNGIPNGQKAFKIEGISETSTGIYGAKLSLQSFGYNGSAYVFREGLSVNSNMTVTIPNLSGTGTRTVVADASGNLSTVASAGIVTSGTYSPTITNISNTSSVSAFQSTYTRVGDIVTVTVGFTLNVTAANTLSEVTISLPINRTATSAFNIGSGSIVHTLTSSSAYSAARVYFNTSVLDKVSCVFYPTSITTTNIYTGSVTFQYSIT